MAKGSSEVLMIPNNFPVCLPAECKGFPLPVCTLWKFSQVQQPHCRDVCCLGCQRSTGIGAHVTKQVKAPVKRLDLSDEAGQTLLWRILKDPRVFAAHLGPHVGHLPGPGRSVKSFGLHPLPLRSDKFPDGLANLPPRDQAHVDTANKL